MGAHPRCPSLVCVEDCRIPLNEWIAAHPREILGDSVVDRFGTTLPFLLKVLAIAQPLSIQAHPNEQQAREGFAKENEANIPLDAPHRNYRDDRPKPEILCALTEFWAFKGFRPFAEIVETFQSFEPLATLLDKTSTNQQDAMPSLFHTVMNLAPVTRQKLVTQIVGQAKQRQQAHPQSGNHDAWIIRLNDLYPGDVGILCALMLQLVHLQPGEAIFLPPGELHAYLEGTGIELMGNSDNVLRGGLTPKHIDIPELLHVLNFHEDPTTKQKPPHVPTKKLQPQETCYQTPAPDFALSVIHLGDHGEQNIYESNQRSQIELLFATSGTAKVTNTTTGQTTPIPQGNALLIPAAVQHYQIQGTATLYKATVPSKE